jgi:riboflavin biosynthesis pyrimidine reductase
MGDIIAPMRRLHPNPLDTITLREAYDVARPRPPDRPWVGVCMVASVDGSTVVDGSSSGLSNPADVELLLTLRDLADVVIVGAGTARSEGYGVPRKPDLRIGVVSRSGNMDYSMPLFTSGRGFMIVPDDAPELPVDTIRAGVGEIDLAAALAQLDADFVQAEGGPQLNGALAVADLIDDIHLTISPQLAGGAGPRLVVADAQLTHRMQLAHVLEDDGFLFTRYVRVR